MICCWFDRLAHAAVVSEFLLLHARTYHRLHPEQTCTYNQQHNLHVVVTTYRRRETHPPQPVRTILHRFSFQDLQSPVSRCSVDGRPKACSSPEAGASMHVKETGGVAAQGLRPVSGVRRPDTGSVPVLKTNQSMRDPDKTSPHTHRRQKIYWKRDFQLVCLDS